MRKDKSILGYVGFSMAAHALALTFMYMPEVPIKNNIVAEKTEEKPEKKEVEKEKKEKKEKKKEEKEERRAKGRA